MGLIAIPFTFTNGTTAVDSEMNTVVSTIYNEFNGNIDNNNIKANAQIAGSKLADNSIAGTKLADLTITDGKFNLTSVLFTRAGTTGVKLAYGQKSGNLVAGTISFIITFSTDSEPLGLYNPSFNNTPRLALSIGQIPGGFTYTHRVSNITNTSATVIINSNGGADVSAVTLDWIAIGT